MKLTLKKIRYFNFIVILSLNLCSCTALDSNQQLLTKDSLQSSSSESNDSSETTNKTQAASEDTEELVEEDVSEETTQKKITMVVMNQGEQVGVQEAKVTVDVEATQDEIYQAIMEQLSDYLGYQITVNDLYMENGNLVIDLASQTAIFHEEEFDITKPGPGGYATYDEMAFGVLDSIKATLKKSSEENFEVEFRKDGEALELPDVTIFTKFSVGEAYQDYKYYLQMYEQRGDDVLLNFINLGMSYNNAVIQLKGHSIDTVQTEEFSLLGDTTGWETFNDLDTYLSHAWTRVDLSNDEYEFIFDGPDTRLFGIYIYGKEIESKRGLKVRDSFDELVKLYGEDYTEYQIEGKRMYEYNLGTNYFQAYFSENTGLCTEYGVISYSQAQLVEGQKIKNEMIAREESSRAVSGETK